MAYELDVWERIGLEEIVRNVGMESVLNRLDKCLSGELEDTREMRRLRERSNGDVNEILEAARSFINIL